MAALTEDRFGTVKTTPDSHYEHFKLDAADTVIYSHSLVTLGANDGLLPVTATDGAVPVFYSVEHYEADFNTLEYDSNGENGQARVEYGVIALLDATGMTAADIGAVVYADDDHTVSKDAAGTGRPKVGRVVKFVSATQVYVYIPGILEDAAEDTTA